MKPRLLSYSLIYLTLSCVYYVFVFALCFLVLFTFNLEFFSYIPAFLGLFQCPCFLSLSPCTVPVTMISSTCVLLCPLTLIPSVSPVHQPSFIYTPSSSTPLLVSFSTALQPFTCEFCLVSCRVLWTCLCLFVSVSDLVKF